MHRMYDDLAVWWPLLSPPEEYASEATFFLPLIVSEMGDRPLTMLELGSGGGHMASHMKPGFVELTLVDISPSMLSVSRRLNPECQHVAGDMRTVRLGRTFDVVFVHDAVDYMTTEPDLRAAIETAFAHCASGGLALFVPDHVRETYEPYTDHGGSDGGERSMRYMDWSYDPDPSDTTVVTEYVFLLREGDGSARVEHEQHVTGLFPRDTWLRLLAAAGFRATWLIDPEDRCVFIARRP